jgi:hypothetical protein
MGLNFKKPPQKRRYIASVLIAASIALLVLMFVAATN